MKLSELEEKIGVVYPTLFKQMEAERLLDWGAALTRSYYSLEPERKGFPPLLYHSTDFELLTMEEVLQEMDWFADPEDYRKVDLNQKFVPFAMNGAHDLYCFYFGAKQGDDVPIVFLYHDDEEGDYLAKNIQDFLFERLIYDMVDIDYYEENDEERSREQLEDTLRTHGKYMKEKHLEALRAIMQRPVQLSDVLNLNGQVIAQVKGLLSEQEARELIKEHIAFDYAGQSFVYMGA